MNMKTKYHLTCLALLAINHSVLAGGPPVQAPESGNSLVFLALGLSALVLVAGIFSRKRRAKNL
ncbi:MAG TPA: LPXTG cell wall anchor domain-containing protein [Chthoniobacterales bacterium]